MSSDLIQALAAELGVAQGTLQRWRSRGSVPHRWRLPIVQLADQRGIGIELAAFDSYRPSNYRGRLGAQHPGCGLSASPEAA